MLAPISSGRRNKGTSFRLLKNYLISERDPETGELQIRGEVVLSDNILSLETADAEMLAAASVNKRCADPVYHYQLAWQPGENPTREQWESAAKKTLADLGFSEHQFLIVAHQDKAHFHVHILVNKVHPETALAHNPFYDMMTLDKALREIEHEQGWRESVGHYRWGSDKGVAVKNNRADIAALSKGQARSSGKAAAFEHYRDALSLQVYVKDKASLDLLGLLSRKDVNWGSVQRMLHGYGLEMKKGEHGGYTVHATGTELHVKASDVFRRSFAGKANRAGTEKKLGEWRDASDEDRAPVKKPLMYEKSNSRDQTKRDLKTEDRDKARRDLKKQFGAYRAEIRAKQSVHTRSVSLRRTAINQGLKDLKKQIRGGDAPWPVKKARMSQAVIESVAQQRQLKVEVMRERLTLRGRAYQEWVGDEAEKGSLAAAAQLRGWRYQDHRNSAKLDTVVASQRDAAHLSGSEDSQQSDWVELTHERIRELRRNEEITRTIAATRWTINRRSGDVHYNVKGHLALVDRGKTISVLNSEETAIVLGLEMAVKKYGLSIKTEGSDSWKERVARVAAKNDVFVQFTDPMMQQILVQEKMKLDQYGVMANQLAGLRDRVVKTPDSAFQLTSRDTGYVFMGGVSGLKRGRAIVNELHTALQPGEKRPSYIKGIFSLEATQSLDGQPVVFVVRPMAGKGTALADLLNTAASQMRQASESQRTSKTLPQKPRAKEREGIGRE
jgi:hypothetical protein